ncbi:DUF6549 family protein [Limibacter armeniacum]|uniref:DUF6549 family protein n=1 Tax=Limibacter armeniacum TaxID=466084 RepID=UPI002FE51D17
MILLQIIEFVRRNPAKVIFALLLLVCWALWIQVQRNSNLKDGYEQMTVLANDARGDLQHYKNKLDYQVSLAETLELDYKTLKNAKENQRLQFLHKFNDLKKKLRRMESAAELDAQLDQFFAAPITDTVKILLMDTVFMPVQKKIALYHDDYTRFAAIINDSTGMVEVGYTAQVPIDLVIYWDRKWFLGKKHFQTEVISENPNIIFKDINTIIKKRR